MASESLWSDEPYGESETHFPIGTKVTCHSLVKMPELNGCIGTVISRKYLDDKNSGRYEVEINKGFTKLLLPKNLSIYEPSESAQKQDYIDMMSMFGDIMSPEEEECYEQYLLESDETQETEDESFTVMIAENSHQASEIARLTAALAERDALIANLTAENARLRPLSVKAKPFDFGRAL
jgi:hypothetical protein